MRAFLHYAILVAVAPAFWVSPTAAQSSAVDPSRVLIVYNASAPAEATTGGVGASSWVASYYRQKRGIPASNLCPISIVQRGTYYNESVSKRDYETLIRDPIAGCLAGRENQIDFIAIMYGVPLRVGDWPADCATWPSYVRELFGGVCRKKPGIPTTVSVDNLLAAIRSPANYLLVSNPYSMRGRTAQLPRIRDFTPQSGFKPYLVYRLDGPTPVIARSLVDRALAGEAPRAVSGSYGYFDCEGDLFPEICAAAQSSESVFGKTAVKLNLNQVTRDMYAPESSVVQTNSVLRISSQGRSTATLRFTFPQTRGALLRVKLASGYVLNSSGSKWGFSPISMSLRSTDNRAGFDANYPLYLWRSSDARLSRVQNGTVSSFRNLTGLKNLPTELGLATTANGASILLDAAPFLTMASSAPEMLSHAAITFKNFRGDITRIEVLNSNGAVIWSDSFTQPIGSRYQIETFGKEGPNAYFVAGAYSGGNYWNAFSFSPGAVGYQLTSYACNSLRRVTNYCPLYLQDGITATLGAVDEPFALEMPKPDTLHNYLYNHRYTYAEAAYAATPSLRWTTVIVGDGLYRPGLVKNLPGGLPAPSGLYARPVVRSGLPSVIEVSWKILAAESGVTGYAVYLKAPQATDFSLNQVASTSANDQDADGSPRKTTFIRYKNPPSQEGLTPGTFQVRVQAFKGSSGGTPTSDVSVVIP